jgi:membrane protease YdiL (CAAX protease family)
VIPRYVEDADEANAGAEETSLDQLILAIAAVVAAGIVGAFGDAAIGVVLDGFLVVALTLLAVTRRSGAEAFAAIALVPLLRLLWLSMPIDWVPIIDWTLLVALPFLAATMILARALELDAATIGLRPGPPLPILASAALIGLTGVVVRGVAGGEVLGPPPTVAPFGILQIVAYAFLVGAAEEIAFRGVVPAAMPSRLMPLGWVAALVLYTSLALATLDVAAVVAFAALGAVATVTVIWSRSLWGAIVGHAIFLVVLAPDVFVL